MINKFNIIKIDCECFNGMIEWIVGIVVLSWVKYKWIGLRVNVKVVLWDLM